MPHPHRSLTHPERFIHVNPDKGLTDKYQAATIFVRKENDGIWRASIALCWRADQFCRATGRKNARRHYFEGRMVEIGDKFDHNKVVHKVFNQTFKSEN